MRGNERIMAACGSMWAVTIVFVASALAQEVTLSAGPDADAFVSSQAPTSNYGAGGALTVSGSAAVNGSGQQNGQYDTLMRFPASNVVAELDSALSGSDWVLTGARLVLTEMASPDNAIFNRGIGEFEVRWIAEDGWLEGTGKPMSPTTDGVTWDELPSILNSNLDVSVGVFTNSGTNATLSFELAIPDRLVNDMRSGGEVGFYLTAKTPEIGVTFGSRNSGKTNSHPLLVLTAAANPRAKIDAVQVLGSNVVVSFSVTSNWACRLQSAPQVAAGAAGWRDVLAVPAQVNGTNVVYVDIMATERFYRLRLTTE